MDEKNILQEWKKLKKLFGPGYEKREAAVKSAAQSYAIAILSAEDENRIRELGKKHLLEVVEKALDGKQFSTFLSHAIKLEEQLSRYALLDNLKSKE